MQQDTFQNLDITAEQLSVSELEAYSAEMLAFISSVLENPMIDPPHEFTADAAIMDQIGQKIFDPPISGMKAITRIFADALAPYEGQFAPIEIRSLPDRNEYEVVLHEVEVSEADRLATAGKNVAKRQYHFPQRG